MRVAVTGATGFVGRWLVPELERAGHVVAAAPSHGELDIRDTAAVRRWIEHVSPESIVHLAAVSFGPAAEASPDSALAITVGGTVALLEAIVASGGRPTLLVTGSSDVYGAPDPSDLPLREMSPLRPSRAYAMTKIAQECIAEAYSARHGFRVVVSRSFNHTGPGQRTDFVVPALARRLLDLSAGRTDRLRVGNLDVRRDFLDVRDVVVAYRLLLEGVTNGKIEGGIYNVCSGSSVAIRTIVEELAALIGVTPVLEVDPELVRPGEPPEIRGDPRRIIEATGWRPTMDRSQTLADVVDGLRHG